MKKALNRWKKSATNNKAGEKGIQPLNKKFTALLTGLLISLLGMSLISQAQSATSQALNPKHQEIVTIAAFTARAIFLI